MNHSEQILQLLKKHSAQSPMRGDALVKKLGIDPDQINDLLDDLQGRGALNRAEITKAGHTYTALWPTGLVPRNLSWKAERDNGKGLMGARLAHNVQQAAEASRTDIKPDQTRPNPTKPDQTEQVLETCPVSAAATEPQEKPMSRIARPAQIVEKVDPAKLVETPHASNRPRNTGINGGAVQSAVLAVLEAGGVLDVDTIFSRLTVATTKGSVGKILETLGKRGVIEATIQFHNKRHRRFYCMPGTDRAAAPVCSEQLCSELEGNLRTLRRIGADDHIADADKMVAVAETLAPQADAPTDPVAALADLADADANRPRWALWDNGMLMITSGDEIIALPRAETERLAEFLHGSAGVVFAPEARV